MGDRSNYVVVPTNEKESSAGAAGGGGASVPTATTKTVEAVSIPTVVTASAAPEKSHFDTIEWQTRPGRDKGPLDIDVVIAFKKWEVTNLTGKEILTWEGVIELYWVDERLVNYPKEFGMPENIFRPRVMGALGFSIGDVEQGKLLPKFAGSDTGLSNGAIHMKFAFALGNGGVNLSDQLLRFKAFPFDSVRVDKNCNFLNPCREGDSPPYFNLKFERPNVKNRLEWGQFQHVDWTATRHSDDYDLVNFAYAIASNPESMWAGYEADSIPCLCLTLQISRAHNFYVHKGIIPLYLVSVFGFMTYSIEPLELGSRISVLSALFLTVYAIQWVTIERLPRLPFATVLDGVAQSAVGSLIALVIGACFSYRMGRPRGGCGLGCLEFDLATAELIDFTVLGITFVYLFFYSFLYEVIYRASRVSQAFGWSRPWSEGPSISNKRFRVVKGKAWQLQTSEEWFSIHETKFMGEGTPVDAETW